MSEPTTEQLQDLVRFQESKIRDLEAADARRSLDTDIGTAIAAAGVKIIPGTEAQVLDLLRPSVHTYTDGVGRRVIGGANFTDLKTHVANSLNGELRHFVAGASQPTTPGAPVGAPGTRPDPAADGAKAWVDWHAQQGLHSQAKQAGIDPRMNPNKSMIRGLKGS